MIPATLAGLAVPIESLRPYERNPRRGNVEAIKASLEAHGQYRPVVARTGGEVLAGNHTLQAALDLGWSELAVTYVDVDDEQAARIVLVDNRSSDLGIYDDGALVDLLQSLDDLEGTGWEPHSLEGLLLQLEQQARSEGRDRDTDSGKAPDSPETQLGDLYTLGDHRLLCGDAFDEAGHVRLDAAPACILSDPPYGIGLETDYRKLPVGSTKAWINGAKSRNTYRPVIGDDKPFDASFIVARYPRAREQFWFGGDFYRRTLSEADLDGSYLVWDKRTEASDKVIGSGFELIWSRQPHKRDLLRHYWSGAMGSAEARNRMHPTQKPVALLAEILDRWTKAGDVVLDPFLGSGSTLIACENLDRHCYGMELDPAYCDVIVDRWERHTGGKAEVERVAA